jgi:hypothetical protein
VRYFVKNLPPVLTDRERLAAHLIQIVNARKAERTHEDDNVRDRALDRSR